MAACDVKGKEAAMAKQKKYSPSKLDKAVRNYFQSISREIVVKEPVRTGKKDENGHWIYEDRPVINSLGQEMKTIEYLIPPTVGGLSDYLGIHRDTWNAYCQDEAYSDTTTYARGRMHAYLEREMLTRPGKDLKGIMFNLDNNYGYSERMELTHDTMEDFLQRQAAGGSGGQEF